MQVRARRPGSPGLAMAFFACALVVATASCDSPVGPGGGPDPNPDPGPIFVGDVLVGAGDIAVCGVQGAEETAKLLDGIAGTVFTAGDNAYRNGTPEDFRDCYEPTWGRHKFRTHPTPGNHDYNLQSQAKPYFDYFGAAAGPRGKGYYTYPVGSWRVIALNSEFFPAAENVPTPGAAAEQLSWLKNELATNVPCTIAIWHRPLFSSGVNGNNPDVRDLYKAAYDGNVDIVINGHDHNYERFAPQDPDGRADSARGIRQFIVGGGGFGRTAKAIEKANSEKFDPSWGVLKLTLAPNAYAWEYIPVPGQGKPDSGTGVCH